MAVKPHSVTLTRTRVDGRAIPGLWESDVVRVEAVPHGWETQCPMRQIGQSNFYEFRNVELGGKWRNVGTYRTRDASCATAERLQAGTHVLRGAYTDGDGPVPAMVVLWADVADEIASHPSVRPAP